MSTGRVRGLLGGAWRRTTRASRHVYGSPRATGRAPHVRMDVDLGRLERTLLVALLPCAAAGVVANGHHVALAGTDVPGWRGALLAALGIAPGYGDLLSCAVIGLLHLLPVMAAVVVAAYACTWVFASARRREVVPGTAATALVFTLLLPAGVAPWQAALGIACGVVLGREIFGGTGRTFVHPAVVGLVVLEMTYPAAFGNGAEGALGVAAAGGTEALHAIGMTWRDTFTGLDPAGLGDASALGCLVGAALLLHHRAASWRVMAGALLGSGVATEVLAGAPAFVGVPWTWHLTLGSLAFVVVFVATDPSSGAFTNAGRWLHGAIVGFLAIAIRVASPAHVEGALLAALLGSVLVPLVDHGVVRLHVLRRRRRV